MDTFDFISNYRDATAESAASSLEFLRQHKKSIIEMFGRQMFKEMLLNHKSHFKKHEKERLLKEYCKLIIPKSTHHTSDLAIGYNILKCMLPIESEDVILDFMYNRILEIQPNVSKFEKIRFLKKNMIIEYIETHVLPKRVE